jgi:hypothetical protein
MVPAHLGIQLNGTPRMSDLPAAFRYTVTPDQRPQDFEPLPRNRGFLFQSSAASTGFDSDKMQ